MQLKYHYTTYSVFLGLLAGTTLLWSIAAIGLWLVSYDTFLDFLSASFQLYDYRERIETSFVTPEKYNSLPIWFCLFCGFNLVFTLLYYQKQDKVLGHLALLIKDISELRRFISLKINTAPNSEKIAFTSSFVALMTICVLAAKLYPLHIDEAFSYVFLVSRGLGVTLTFYPGPNNHIAFLILCNALEGWVQSPLWVMRTPALIIVIFFIPLCYGFLRLFSSWQVSLLTLWGFTLSSYGLFYAVHGRGYYMMLCLAIIMLISMFSMTRYKALAGWSFILSGSLGLFTIPSFAYYFTSIVLLSYVHVLFINHSKQGIGRLTVLSIVSVLFAVFLYLPALFVSGKSAIISNVWVESLGWSQWLTTFPSYLSDWVQFPFGEGMLGAALTLMAFLGLLFVNPDKKRIYIGVFIFISLPMLLIFMQQVFPPLRTWLFQLLMVCFLMMSFLSGLSRHVLKRSWIIPAFSLLILFTVNIRQLEKDWLAEDTIYEQVNRATTFMVEKNANAVFVSKDIYNVFLRLNYQQQKKNLTIETNLQKLNEQFEWIIWNKQTEMPLASQYATVYSDDFVNIYHRKGKSPL